jgi:hypothetical protein
MGYIVDLTLVMDRLFLTHQSFRRLTAEDINLAIENYTNSLAAVVHREIRSYANKATFVQICRSNNAEEKVKELIEQHRTKRTEPES